MSVQEVGAAFQEATVQADGLSIRYWEAGEGEPIVVLHGAGGPRLNPALDLLATRFRVLLFEMPGFGEEANERTTSLTEMAETMARAAATVGVDRYHLMGTSFGGAVALQIALAHREHLISLVLEAPGAFREGMSSPVGVDPEVVIGWMRAHPEKPPALTVESMSRGQEGRALVGRLLLAGPPYDPELAARLETLDVRTLVLFGDRDGLLPCENGRIYRRLMPNCAYVIVHDAGHDIQADRPEAYADVVGEFLERGIGFLLPDKDTIYNP